MLFLGGSLSAQKTSTLPLENGDSAFLRGDYPAAINSYRIYEETARAARDSSALGEALRKVGETFRASAQSQEALRYLRNALKIAESIHDTLLMVRIQDRLAATYFDISDYNGTLKHAAIAKSLALQSGYEERMPIILNIIGASYREIGDNAGALATLYESVDHLRRSGDTTDLSNAYNNIANSLRHVGKYQAAADTAIAAFRIAERQGNLAEMRYASGLASAAYRALGKLDLALEWQDRYTVNALEAAELGMGKEMARLLSEMKDAERLRENEALKIMNAEQSKQIDLERNYAITAASFATVVLILAIILLIVARNQRKANAALRDKNAQIQAQTDKISKINSELAAAVTKTELQQERLLEMVAVKDKLFSVISHDLRSPLTSIEGMLLLLEQNLLSELESRKMAESLKTRVNQTTLLLDNLLNWSQVRAEGFVPSFQPLQLTELTDQEFRFLESSATHKFIQFKNTIARELCCTGDRLMVGVVLRNLLSNAIKFCNPGGTILVGSQAEGKFHRIWVEDNGVGIPEDLGARVMGESYFSTLGTESEKGSGMGLRLCKDFIAMNGGEIGFEQASTGQGTRFWFTLPA